MATGWNVMDALNNKTKAAAVDNKPKARFRTKDINIDQLYSNDKNFYSIPDIEQLARDIFAVGLLENLTVVHDPCDRGEYRIIAGERRWRALTLLVEQGHEEFAVASCQIKTPAEENEEMIQLIIANTYRNKTTADILEEQKKLEETLKHMKEQGLTLNGYKLDSGRLRDVIADMMQVSSTKIAQIESINKKLIPEFTEELKNGGLTFSAAYEISKMSEDIQEDMLEHHREKGLTYKDVKEYADEQKKAEEEQIDGQLNIEDINDGACQNLTPEENSDQSEKEKEYEETEEKETTEEIKTHDTTTVSDVEETGQEIEQNYPAKCITGKSKSGICGAAAYCSENYSCCAECDQNCNSRCGWIDDGCDVAQDEQQPIVKRATDCPPDQNSCLRQNWGTSREDQHEGQKECAKCWNRYKSLHKQEETEIPEEKKMKAQEDITEKEDAKPELCEEISEKTDLDIAKEENEKYRRYLEMAKEGFDSNDIRIRTYKVLIAALAGYIHDLDMIMNPSEESEQPELPKFKNNDQRKEWLRNYEDWGLWYTDRNINVNYYKYDFADGSRLVVAEYQNRINGWNGKEKEDEYYLHLLEKDKKPYGDGKPYDKQYMNATDSETYLVEFLKNLQKNTV